MTAISRLAARLRATLKASRVHLCQQLARYGLAAME
jgi:hypothetical protein